MTSRPRTKYTKNPKCTLFIVQLGQLWQLAEETPAATAVEPLLYTDTVYTGNIRQFNFAAVSTASLKFENSSR